MARLRRLDAELVRRGLARSRQQAAELVTAGRVSVSGGLATKAATQVDPAVPIVITDDLDDPGYASRGGHKLVGALDAFAPSGDGRRSPLPGRGREHRRVHRRPAAPRAPRASSPWTSGTGSWSGRCGPTRGSSSSSAPTCATSPRDLLPLPT